SPHETVHGRYAHARGAPLRGIRGSVAQLHRDSGSRFDQLYHVRSVGGTVPQDRRQGNSGSAIFRTRLLLYQPMHTFCPAPRTLYKNVRQWERKAVAHNPEQCPAGAPLRQALSGQWVTYSIKVGPPFAPSWACPGRSPSTPG